MDGIYLHDWSESKLEGLKKDFDIGDPELQGAEILLASYTYQNWSGDAFVLFRKDGKLFEINASHCSCYGLENQWQPEKVVLAELKNRVTEGDFGADEYTGNEFRDELFALILELEEG